MGKIVLRSAGLQVNINCNQTSNNHGRQVELCFFKVEHSCRKGEKHWKILNKQIS